MIHYDLCIEKLIDEFEKKIEITLVEKLKYDFIII
jgi:hypothetical protein